MCLLGETNINKTKSLVGDICIYLNVHKFLNVAVHIISREQNKYIALLKKQTIEAQSTGGIENNTKTSSSEIYVFGGFRFLHRWNKQGKHFQR